MDHVIGNPYRVRQGLATNSGQESRPDSILTGRRAGVGPTPALRDILTGGKGSITQWVHAEYMEGSETICPTFTQWVRGGYFQKYPPKYPLGNSLKEPSVFFENFIQKVPIMCLSHSMWVLSKSTH